MTKLETNDVAYQSLAERLAEGPIPVDQALRHAAQLGEELRKIHDSGKSHGSVSPASILVTGDGVELTGGMGDATGIPNDIFAFGTVLAEMMQANSDGSDAGEHSTAPLIASCLSRNPVERPPSMQKVLLELKLASLAARHSERAAKRVAPEVAMRAEILRAEEQQEERLKEHETRMAEKHQAATDALDSVHARMEALEGQLASIQHREEANAYRLRDLEDGLNSAIQELGAKITATAHKLDMEFEAQTSVLESVRSSMARTDDLIGRVVDTVEAKLAAAQGRAEENAGRCETLEHGIQEAADQNAVFESRVADSLHQIQADLGNWAATVETLRKSMAQTDDLVGRVVEAVESIMDLRAVSA